MSWKGNLVAIFAPTGDGEDGKIGTGIPVGHDLILTARHVVRPQGRGSGRIHLKFWYSAKAAGWQEAASDHELIVWECETHDVAILRHPVPEDIGACLISGTGYRSHDQWESEGFPAAARRNGEITPAPFIGKILARADEETFHEADTNSKKPQALEQWGGASGMPIVVEGSIVGVAVHVEDGFGTGQIKFAPIWRIWRDNELFKQFFIPDQLLVSAKRRLKRALSNLAKVPLALECVQEAVDGEWSNDDHAANVELLLACRHSDFVPRVNRCVADYELSGDSFRALAKFMSCLAPVLFAQKGVLATQAHETSGNAVVIEAPIATLTMAELLLAWASGRNAEFEPRRMSKQFPPGTHWIPLRPEVGDDPDGSRVVWEVAKDISRWIPETNTSDLKGLARQYLGQALLPGQAPDLDALRAQMQIMKQGRMPLPYLAFVLPENVDESEFAMDVLSQVRAKLPDLQVIVLDREMLAKDILELAGYPDLTPIIEADMI